MQTCQENFCVLFSSPSSSLQTIIQEEPVDKKISAPSDHQIEVEFLGGMTPDDVQGLMESCEEGSCGCDMDLQNDFQDVRLSEEKAQVLFQKKTGISRINDPPAEENRCFQ